MLKVQLTLNMVSELQSLKNPLKVYITPVKIRGSIWKILLLYNNDGYI